MSSDPAIEPVPSTFPVAAIICLAIGGYVVLVAIILCIRSCLQQRGVCIDGCCGPTWCGREGQPQCCECCIVLSESCNCCGSPSFDACIDSICPARRKLDCAEIIMCQCTDSQCCDCCYNQEPFCDCNFCRPGYPLLSDSLLCNRCSCTCTCQMPKCENINCCCFQLNQRPTQPPVTSETILSGWHAPT